MDTTKDFLVDRKKYDPPDSLTSVGVTTARHITLTDAEHPFRLQLGGVLPEVVVE